MCPPRTVNNLLDNLLTHFIGRLLTDTFLELRDFFEDKIYIYHEGVWWSVLPLITVDGEQEGVRRREPGTVVKETD